MTALLFLTSCDQPCGIPEYDPNNKVDTISLKTIESNQTNLENWLTQIVNCSEPIENNNIWFSIESLTNYLSYAQHKSTTMVAMPEITGIRFYLGKEGNKLTVMASATYKSTVTTTTSENDPDLGFGVLNYGSAGMPPKKTYAHPQ